MPSSLSVRINPAAQRTIKLAFEDLERSISAGDRDSLKETTLENVRQAAHAIENQLAARQCLRNMRRLAPLFDGLAHYSKTIEVLCNGTPYLPWMWAPIKLILKISSDYIEAFEKVIAGYARIAEPLKRFALLDQSFSKNVHVQQTLAVFYADILRFHKKAYKFVRRGGWRALFLSSWGRFERPFSAIIEDLRVHEALVDKTAIAVSISEAREQREELLDKLAKDEERLTTDQYLAVIGWLKINVCDQPRIFDSIVSEAVDGTCGWIVQQPKVANFMRCSTNASFLVLKGNPGTGKSVLASQVSNLLVASGKSLVITHFCTYSYASSLEYDQILGSILNGLIKGNTDLTAHTFQELILKKKPATSKVLKQLLTELVAAATLVPSQIRYIHIVVDGLDECGNDTQLEVIKLLGRIVSETSHSGSVVCKVLLTSRGTGPTAKHLKQKHSVSLSEERSAVDQAIRTYVSSRFALLSSRLADLNVNSDNVEDLVHRIVAKADGMFLWARLVLDYLATNLFVNHNEFLDAADRLPRKLSEFYCQILTQILKCFDERSVSRTKVILGWVAFAKRPLKKIELRSALAFADGVTDVSDLAPEYVIDACGSLVEQRADSTLAFIHISVKEFLQSSESNVALNEMTANREQGLAVLTCLLSGFQHLVPSQPEVFRSRRILRGIHALQTYATEYWTDYLLFVGPWRDEIDAESPFNGAARQLAAELTRLCPDENDDQPSAEQLDRRLLSFDGESYKELHNIICRTLRSRHRPSETANKSADLDTGETGITVTDPQELLAFYQSSIRGLLSLRSYHGITLQEFEKFKQDFRTTAFGCHFWSCPRVSRGFDSAEQLREHEASHYRIVCQQSGCQYPPFPSQRALKDHQSNCHTHTRPRLRRSIMRLHSDTQSSSQRSPANHSVGGDKALDARSSQTTNPTDYTVPLNGQGNGTTPASQGVPQPLNDPQQQPLSSTVFRSDLAEGTPLRSTSPFVLLSDDSHHIVTAIEIAGRALPPSSPLSALPSLLERAIPCIRDDMITHEDFWDNLVKELLKRPAFWEMGDNATFWMVVMDSIPARVHLAATKSIWTVFVRYLCYYTIQGPGLPRDFSPVFKALVAEMPLATKQDPEFWGLIIDKMDRDPIVGIRSLSSCWPQFVAHLSDVDLIGIANAMKTGTVLHNIEVDQLFQMLRDLWP